MSEVLLSALGVSKKFARSLKRSLSYALIDVVREMSGGRKYTDKLRPGEFWALKDINVNLRRGEALGLLGPNGSGKSTLLRIISGLIKPDTGQLRIKGRVAPLIALGAGFSPLLTGRENVFVNMAILGMNHAEITRRFDDVIQFAEIGEAIDSPVQTYSSGMVARLGFACAIHTTPDILLIDEVLSVGDIRFRAKCYRRLAEIKRSGTAFVLVSHSTNAILSMCDSAVYINKGETVVAGESAAVIERYERDLLANPGTSDSTSGALACAPKDPALSMGLDILAVYLKDEHGIPVTHLTFGAAGTLCVSCRVRRQLRAVGVWLIIRQIDGELTPILTLHSELDGTTFDLPEGIHELQCRLPYCGLRPSIYTAKVSAIQGSIYVLDGVESFRFEVRSGATVPDSAYFQPRQWFSNDSPEQPAALATPA